MRIISRKLARLRMQFIQSSSRTMNESWTDRWNEKYRIDEYAYGKEPNQFLKEQLAKLEPATILFPAEGEGRNAVYAATLGWNVFAFDISQEGKQKALRLAESNAVNIDYKVGELQTLDYQQCQFDAIALIYAHFPAAIKSQYHKMLSHYLRPDGIVIFEAFSKQHIAYNSVNPNIGGPKDVASLFSLEEIRADFQHYDILLLEELETELHEGLYHNGKGSVIRFVGRKK